MKAVKEQPQFRLTSNFTFRTMQKVEEAILLREKKQERKMLLATIAASLFLIISGSIGLYIYFGKHIKETMYHVFFSNSKSTLGALIDAIAVFKAFKNTNSSHLSAIHHNYTLIHGF